MSTTSSGSMVALILVKPRISENRMLTSERSPPSVRRPFPARSSNRCRTLGEKCVSNRCNN